MNAPTAANSPPSAMPAARKTPAKTIFTVRARAFIIAPVVGRRAAILTGLRDSADGAARDVRALRARTLSVGPAGASGARHRRARGRAAGGRGRVRAAEDGPGAGGGGRA